MGWTLGLEPLLVVQWDYPGMSHLYQMVRDGHLGLNPSGWYNGIIPDVPPVPNGTMVQDGQLGLNPTCWYSEIILDVPPVPNGTMVRDGHLGLNPT